MRVDVRLHPQTQRFAGSLAHQHDRNSASILHPTSYVSHPTCSALHPHPKTNIPKTDLHVPYPSWKGRGSLSIPEGAWQKPPSIWMLESQEKLLVGPKECHGRGQLTPGITSGRGGKVDLENSTCMPTVPSPDPPALGGGGSVCKPHRLFRSV